MVAGPVSQAAVDPDSGMGPIEGADTMYQDIFNTDPLAWMALAGFGSVIVVTIVLFVWLMLRMRNPNKPALPPK